MIQAKKSTQRQLEAQMLAINTMLREIYNNKSTDEYKMKGDITKSPSYSTIEQMVADLAILRGFFKVDADDIKQLFNTLHRPVFKNLVKEYIMEQNDRNTVFTAMFTVGYRLLVGELSRIYASTEATPKGIVYKPDKVSRQKDAGKLIRVFNEDLEKKLDQYVRDMKKDPGSSPVNEAFLTEILAGEEFVEEGAGLDVAKKIGGTALGGLIGFAKIAIPAGILGSTSFMGAITVGMLAPFLCMCAGITTANGAIKGYRLTKKHISDKSRRDLVDELRHLSDNLVGNSDKSDITASLKKRFENISYLSGAVVKNSANIDERERRLLVDMRQVSDDMSELKYDASSEGDHEHNQKLLKRFSDVMTKLLVFYGVLEKTDDKAPESVQEAAGLAAATEAIASATKTSGEVMGIVTLGVGMLAGLFKGVAKILQGINPIADINYLFMNSYEKKIAKLENVSVLYYETKRAYDEYMKIPDAQRNKKVESKYMQNIEKYNITMQNLAAQIEHFNQRAKKESQQTADDIEKKIPSSDSSGSSSGSSDQSDDDFQF